MKRNNMYQGTDKVTVSELFDGKNGNTTIIDASYRLAALQAIFEGAHDHETIIKATRKYLVPNLEEFELKTGGSNIEKRIRFATSFLDRAGLIRSDGESWFHLTPSGEIFLKEIPYHLQGTLKDDLNSGKYIVLSDDIYAELNKHSRFEYGQLKAAERIYALTHMNN